MPQHNEDMEARNHAGPEEGSRGGAEGAEVLLNIDGIFRRSWRDYAGPSEPWSGLTDDQKWEWRRRVVAANPHLLEMAKEASLNTQPASLP